MTSKTIKEQIELNVKSSSEVEGIEFPSDLRVDMMRLIDFLIEEGKTSESIQKFLDTLNEKLNKGKND